MTTRFEQLLVLPLALAIFIALSATPTPAAMIAVTNDVASTNMGHTIVDCAIGPSTANPNALLLFTNWAQINTVEAASLGGISYTNDLGLNPRPKPRSPAMVRVAPQGSNVVATPYRGAFAPRDRWADGWTCLSQGGFLMPARGAILTPTLVADPLSNGVFRLWFDPEAGSTYVIEASIDFRTWTPLATNGPVSTWIEYVEANMSSISQFYRARLVE